MVIEDNTSHADTLLDRSAVELVSMLRAGEVSSVDLVTASLDRIDAIEPTLNAFVSIDREGALREAKEADRAVHGHDPKPLHGLPIAVKDLTDVRGQVTTQGSRLFMDAVAATDEVSIARLRRAGAIVLGKTNTPEFGFGAVCTNRVCGPTRNPWHTELTSGGSSGGSAVAVTSGMVPLAQGGDFGGSVRTPAAFCGCVGYRPTPGRIPEPARFFAWDGLSTQGILARDVGDAELMLSIMAGADPLDPLSARATAPRPSGGRLRVAASTTLGGEYRVDPAVREAFDRAVAHARGVFETVADAAPDARGGSETFQVLRAGLSWMKFRELVQNHSADLTESFVWNVERGAGIGLEEFLAAEHERSAIYRRFVRFFDDFDILILPGAAVMPFPIAQSEVHRIDGVPTENIIDYLACTYLISLVGFPCLVLPAPDFQDGLPFGVQLVARPDDEATLVAAALALEEAGFHHRWPTRTDTRTMDNQGER